MEKVTGAFDQADVSSAILDAYLTVLKRPVFYLDKVKVTETVTVRYRSTLAKLQAVISAENVKWLVFLDKGLGHWKDLKTQLDMDQPIAQCVVAPDANSVLPDPKDWEIFVPQSLDFTVQAQPLAPTDGKEDGFRIAGVYPSPGSPASAVLLATRIAGSIVGAYYARPACGAAEMSLFVKPARKDEKRVFLFKEVHRLSSSRDDHMVFASTCGQLDTDEFREVILHLAAKHSLHLDSDKVDQSRSLQAHVKGFWVATPGAILSGGYQAAGSEDYGVGTAEEFRSKASCMCTSEDRQIAVHAVLPLTDLPLRQQAMSRWRFELIRHGQGEHSPPLDMFYRIEPTMTRDFLRCFAFAGAAVADAAMTVCPGESSI